MVKETSTSFIEGKVEEHLVIIENIMQRFRWSFPRLVPTSPSFGCQPSLKVFFALYPLCIEQLFFWELFIYQKLDFKAFMFFSIKIFFFRRLNHFFSESIIVFFSLFLVTPWLMEFPGQGSDLSWSCDLCCSWGQHQILNPLCWAQDRTCIPVLWRCYQPHCTIVGALINNIWFWYYFKLQFWKITFISRIYHRVNHI